MPRERIRKLAKRLEVPTDDLLKVLEQLGHARYRHPSDMLPEAVVAEVQRAFRRSRPSAFRGAGKAGSDSFRSEEPARAERGLPELPEEFPGEPALSAALKEYLAANPLAQAKVNSTRTETPRDVKPSPATAAPQPGSTEARLRESLGAEIRQRRMLADTLEETRADLARLKASFEAREQALRDEIAAIHKKYEAQERLNLAEKARLEQELADLQESLGERVALLERELHDTAASEREYRAALEETRDSESRLQEDLASLRTRLAEEVVARQVAEGRVERLEQKLKEAHAREVVPRATPTPTPESPAPLTNAVPLDEVFERRGLRGPDEVRTALRVLLRDSFYHTTMELLATFSPAALERALERTIALVCENCDPPENHYPIRVEDEARCEVCHGTGLDDSVARFVTICRERGIHRINLVGGAPGARRRLAEALSSHLDIRLIDQPLTIPPDWLRDTAENVDLTILWGDSFLDHRVISQFSSLQNVHVIHVVHPGPGGMLNAATRAVADSRPVASLFDKES